MPETTRVASARSALDDAPRARVQRIVALLATHGDPLSVRLRPARLEDLAKRLAGVVASSFDAARDDARAVALLCAAVPRALQLLDDELVAARRQLDELGTLLARIPDPASRRRALSEFLDRTVTDARERRRDQRALARFFDLDVLRERHTRRVELGGIHAEQCFRLLESAAAELASGGPALCELAGLGNGSFARALEETLCRGVAHPRWQTGAAAVRATFGLAEVAGRFGQRALPPAVLHAIVVRADAPDEHVLFVREALPVAAWMTRGDARAFLLRHALPNSVDDAPTRAVVRAAAIRFAMASTLFDDRVATLQALAEPRDPSEHVRMTLAECAVSLGVARLLEPFLVLGDTAPEESPRVRAVAVRAMIARCRETDVFVPLLSATFLRESEALVLEVGAEACASAVEHAPDDAEHAARMRALLRHLRRRDELPPGVHEASAAAVERIDAAVDADRRAVADALRRAVTTLPEGRSVDFPLAALPASAAARARDASWFARILAELARDGFGFDASPTPTGYRITHGDRRGIRSWRLLHELLHRAPNKRQAHTHTRGRVLRGTLRAHPGHMDEVTATTVPGERVTVDGQGGWGRHLPTVDDVLDLPLRAAMPVQIASSHGLTTVRPPAALAARLRNRARVTAQYARYAALRLASLRGTEPSQRRAYVRALRDELGVDVAFTPHASDDAGAPAVPPHVRTTFDLGGVLALGAEALAGGADFLREQAPALLSPVGHSPGGLAVFSGTLLAAMMARSYAARSAIRTARAQIPMTIGGWGTRGKSGTERIKAALFHGLGFQTLVKTTGCEAMFIHSVPGQRPLEVFLYRPYDKATIWEQANLVRLAAKLRAEVFLWECMALNPRYVDVLAHEWMRDDLTTLTNAFPDHEDIQGPAGQDVAEVIANFIPEDGLCFTSEVNFLPLFEARARAKHTKLVAVPPSDADLLPDDLLRLFPYQEHPRNIALVLRMAAHFGIPRDVALVLMAEHVVPDLGVLKAYPEVCVSGRRLRFLNGMSANERTGCVGNWRRMGLDAIDVDAAVDEVVVTVVNNRDDRVARSEVFGRILVEDLAADRHVLIGTNLGGLVGYVDAALARLLPTLEVFDAEDPADAPASLAEARLAKRLTRLRVPSPSVDGALARLDVYARGAGSRLAAPGALAPLLARWLAPAATDAVRFADVLAALEADAALRTALDTALAPAEHAPDPAHPEVLAPATCAEVVTHFLHGFAKMVVHARLRARLPAGRSRSERDTFHAALRDAWRALVHASLVVVSDSKASGDQIVARVAASIPPGTRASVMGIQNIKGTGLDFAYRWVALEFVTNVLDELHRESPTRRARAFTALETFGDHGLVDAGLACARLRAFEETLDAQSERDRARALRQRLETLHADRVAALTARRHLGSAALAMARRALARAVDHLDSVRRTRESRQILDDLVTERITIPRAARELRALTARQKHG
jgi:poly-gamma-glutamate synthase PgsB/CapB